MVTKKKVSTVFGTDFSEINLFSFPNTGGMALLEPTLSVSVHGLQGVFRNLRLGEYFIVITF